jgi:hypothetical protein
MPNWRSMIEKDFLGAWDLVDPQTGTPCVWTLKIKAVRSELLKTKETPKGKRKVVIEFYGVRKKFVSNATNCTTIEGFLGADTDGWKDQAIDLQQADVRDPKTGQTIKGIRVRSKKPNREPATSMPDQPVDRGMRDEQNKAFGRGQEEAREPGSDG